MLDRRGAASLMMVKLASGVTAALVAAAAIVQEGSTTQYLPISIGGVLQMCALGGIAVIWYLVRGAFNDLKKRQERTDAKCDKQAERIAYIEGTCTACVSRRHNPEGGASGSWAPEGSDG
jgi:hypothetical protein